MKFKDAKLVYDFAESDYDMYEIEASFSTEEAAIEFGAQNVVHCKENRRKVYNKPILYSLDVRVLFDSYDEYINDPTDDQFWEDYTEYFDNLRDKIATRVKEIEGEK